jgi:hypothetical protein
VRSGRRSFSAAADEAHSTLHREPHHQARPPHGDRARERGQARCDPDAGRAIDDDATLHAEVAALLAEFGEIFPDDEDDPTDCEPTEVRVSASDVYAAFFLRAFDEVLDAFERDFSDEMAQRPAHTVCSGESGSTGLLALRAVLDLTLVRMAQATGLSPPESARTT